MHATRFILHCHIRLFKCQRTTEYLLNWEIHYWFVPFSLSKFFMKKMAHFYRAKMSVQQMSQSNLNSNWKQSVSSTMLSSNWKLSISSTITRSTMLVSVETTSEILVERTTGSVLRCWSKLNGPRCDQVFHCKQNK